MLTRGALARCVLPIVVGALLGAPGVAHASFDLIDPMVERCLTVDAAEQSHAAISGTRVAYQDFRNGNWDIYLYDLTTGAEKRLTTDPADQTMPAISGTRVVWQDFRSGDWEIYLYDLTSGTESRMDPYFSRGTDPSISGTTIAYIDNYRVFVYDLVAGHDSVGPGAIPGSGTAISGTWIVCYGWQGPAPGPQLCAWNTATGEWRDLTSGSFASSPPSISGTWIVCFGWQGPAPGPQLCAWNIATGEWRELTSGSFASYGPSISGDKVVYFDDRNGNDDVYLYDLSTDTEVQLTTDPANQNYPAISSSKVVYADNRSSGDNIYLYDLVTGVEMPLMDDGSNQWYPAISGDNVVWQDFRSGNWDVFLGELTTPRMTTSAPSVVALNATAKFSGTLKSIGGIPLASRAVVLELSDDGVSWSTGTSTFTDELGRFVFNVWVGSAVYVRADFFGELTYMSAQSTPILIKPRALLGTPVAPGRMARTKTYKVYGSLSPPHALGTAVGTLKCYRYSAGKWRLAKTVTISYDSSGLSRYRASVKLPVAGRWRLRAYHSDAGHAPTYSGWRYVTVR
jgi:beta propeller repeat protein